MIRSSATALAALVLVTGQATSAEPHILADPAKMLTRGERVDFVGRT